MNSINFLNRFYEDSKRPSPGIPYAVVIPVPKGFIIDAVTERIVKEDSKSEHSGDGSIRPSSETVSGSSTT